MKFIFLYIISVSLISVIFTVYDKCASKLRRRRIPEKTLMVLGLLGGAFTMLAAMLLIRHKTRHFKFMICLPLFTALHAVIILLLLR